MQRGTRAELEQLPRKKEDVAIEELDRLYTVREMSGTERDTFEISTFKEKDGVDKDGKPTRIRTVDTKYLRARLVGLCLVDEAGARLYGDNETKVLSDTVGASAIDRLFKVAQKLNGLEGEAVEDATKNSASVPADASPSDLPLH